MKTLYISDLDGTLLNANAELSGYTVQTLNRLIDNGVLPWLLLGLPPHVFVCSERVKINVLFILMTAVALI